MTALKLFCSTLGKGGLVLSECDCFNIPTPQAGEITWTT